LFSYNWTIVLIIPGIILSLWAQWKVKHAYAKYAEIGTQAGITGAQVAARILQEAGIGLVGNTKGATGQVVGLEAIPGQMTDHYDPRDRTLRLSQDVYNGHSIAAIGIAAHEVGHAIQHAKAYSMLLWRTAIYPATRFASTLAWPLLLAGFIFSFKPLISIGIAFFAFAVLFTLITLPVEFDASRRAIRALSNGGYLTDDELYGAKKVLSAAAWTYVAAAAVAILELVRLLIMSRSR